MKVIILSVLLLAICVGAFGAAKPFENVVFIDHFNLRKVYDKDDAQLAREVAEIKKSLDVAKSYGADSYILFSRSFESLINYDFEVAGLGDLSGKVWPMGDKHRADQARYAALFNDVIDYADNLGIKIIMHTNQFDFPQSLYKMAGDKMSGSSPVCPGKPLAFELLKGKIDEFFKKFPKVAGLQFTLSETQARVTDCNCEACRNLSVADRVVKVADAAYEGCKRNGKATYVRTWGKYELPEIVDRLPKEIICSTKFTLPDFHLTNYPNPVMGQNGERQEVEFDGWGEYSGYNQFPCYYGDLFAPRMKECAEKGVRRVGVRLNWEPGVEYIFDKPYGNEVNIYVFTKLAVNPDGDPDAYLREYIEKTFPASARDAAFRLYKRSTALQTLWLTWRGTNANDHSRIYNGGVGRVRRQFGFAVPEGYDVVKKLVDGRRREIDDSYNEAVSLVNDLGPDIDPAWKSDMLRGARTSYFVAHSNCDCIEMYAAALEAEAGKPLPDISILADNLKSRSELWKRTDPERYDLMFGAKALYMLDDVMKLKK